MLDAHSRIHCGTEVKFFRDFFGDYAADDLAHLRFFATARALVDEDELLIVAGRSFIELHERAAARAGKPRWADKNPENVLYFDSWQRLLQGRLYFVHVVRPPLATIASMTEADFSLTIPSDLSGRIEHYRRLVEAGLAIGGRCLHVSYDALVSEPEAQLARLMMWLGDVPEDAQLDINRSPHSGLEDPKIAATERIHTDSVERWQTAFDDRTIEQIITATDDLWKRAAAAAAVTGG